MDNLATNGWLWISLAAILVFFELLLPGWAFLSIAAAMAITGASLAFNIWSPSFPIALLLTATLSGVIWGILWACLPTGRGKAKIWHSDVNEPPSTLR